VNHLQLLVVDLVKQNQIRRIPEGTDLSEELAVIQVRQVLHHLQEMMEMMRMTEMEVMAKKKRVKRKILVPEQIPKMENRAIDAMNRMIVVIKERDILVLMDHVNIPVLIVKKPVVPIIECVTLRGNVSNVPVMFVLNPIFLHHLAQFVTVKLV
jgi:hypothetical protein